MERIAHPVSKANAQCELCKFNVSLLNMGEKALHSYAARKNHKKEVVRELKKSSIFKGVIYLVCAYLIAAFSNPAVF